MHLGQSRGARMAVREATTGLSAEIHLEGQVEVCARVGLKAAGGTGAESESRLSGHLLGV